MLSHKFKIGETVMVTPAISRNVPGGAYQATSNSLTMAGNSHIASRAPTKSMSASREKANSPGHSAVDGGENAPRNGSASRTQMLAGRDRRAVLACAVATTTTCSRSHFFLMISMC
jgi:hypothetical protein